MAHESIVVQIGSYANFIGAHWWNLQESSFIYDSEIAKANVDRTNHDVLFREGSDMRDNYHYTPRLIVIDDKSNVGCCEALRYLKSRAEEDECKQKFTSSWNTEATIIDQTLSNNNILAKKAAEFASVGSYGDVKTWTDFLRVPYHPKSVTSFPNIAQEDVVTKYIDGYLLAQTESFRDELESKFRFFIEDCDRLQGFNIISDVHDAFSGISSSILLYLRDECPRSTVMCYPVLPPQIIFQSKSDNHQTQCAKVEDKWTYSNHVCNLTVSLCKFLDESNLVLPLTLLESLDKNSNIRLRKFPAFSYETMIEKHGVNLLPPTNQQDKMLVSHKSDAQEIYHVSASSLYHTSAILASAMESSTIPWRLMGKSCTMNDLVDYMTEFHRKLATCGIDFLSSKDLNVDFVGLSPEFSKTENDPFSRSIISLQGANMFCKTFYDVNETEVFRSKLVSVFSERKSICYLTSDSQILKPYYPSIFKDISHKRITCPIMPITYPNINLPVITQTETSRSMEKLIDLLITNSTSSEMKRLMSYTDMSDFTSQILHSTKKCYETE